MSFWILNITCWNLMFILQFKYIYHGVCGLMCYCSYTSVSKVLNDWLRKLQMSWFYCFYPLWSKTMSLTFNHCTVKTGWKDTSENRTQLRIFKKIKGKSWKRTRQEKGRKRSDRTHELQLNFRSRRNSAESQTHQQAYRPFNSEILHKNLSTWWNIIQEQL